MPRLARKKISDGLYHVMVRSISEIYLFKDSKDKEKYLELIKKYQSLYFFKVYAYCLMNNHGHFIIDSNGADISKFMKLINQSYAAYFNKKYNRHGHVFQDRFKSKLIDNDKYLITLSYYIHQNVKDIKRFKDSIEKYKYSSLGIYLGVYKDTHKILDICFILKYFDSNISIARKAYLNFINSITHSNINIEFENEGSEYKSERKVILRDVRPGKIYEFIKNSICSSFNVHIKYNRYNIELKSLFIVIMRSLCDLNLKDICSIIGNTSLSNISRLSSKGLNLLANNDKYSNLFEDIITKFAA
jgi:REP element-mobilizing transposase RayT